MSAKLTKGDVSREDPTDIFARRSLESVIVGYALSTKVSGTNKAEMQKGGNTYVKEKLQCSESCHPYTKHNR